MNVDEWKKLAIQYFKSGRATEAHWIIMANCLLIASESVGLDDGLDEAIEPAKSADQPTSRELEVLKTLFASPMGVAGRKCKLLSMPIERCLKMSIKYSDPLRAAINEYFGRNIGIERTVEEWMPKVLEVYEATKSAEQPDTPRTETRLTTPISRGNNATDNGESIGYDKTIGTSAPISDQPDDISDTNSSLLIDYIEKACLCDDMLDGFDYGERHKRMGFADVGKRWLTPRQRIQAEKLGKPKSPMRESVEHPDITHIRRLVTLVRSSLGRKFQTADYLPDRDHDVPARPLITAACLEFMEHQRVMHEWAEKAEKALYEIEGAKSC